MEIENILQTNPSLIGRAAEQAENIRHAWQLAKEVYNKNEAKFILTLKATKPDLKTTEMKYYINNDEELYKFRLKLVGNEAGYRKEEVKIKSLEEELRAAKMLARIKISEMGNLGDSLKENILKQGGLKNGMGR